jgi:hypothetical protein
LVRNPGGQNSLAQQDTLEGWPGRLAGKPACVNNFLRLKDLMKTLKRDHSVEILYIGATLPRLNCVSLLCPPRPIAAVFRMIAHSSLMFRPVILKVEKSFMFLLVWALFILSEEVRVIEHSTVLISFSNNAESVAD